MVWQAEEKKGHKPHHKNSFENSYLE